MALVAYASSDEDVDDTAEVEETSVTRLAEDTSTTHEVVHSSLFSELPAPKLPDVSLEPELIVEPSEKELSLREKPPPTQPTGPLVLPVKKKKLIQLPSLLIDNSDEEDVPEGQTKIPPSSKASVGVFGNLPKPKYSSVKEIGRNLIPHVLTKQPELPRVPTSKETVRSKLLPNIVSTKLPPKAGSNSAKETSADKSLTADYGSEDEDGTEVSSFFSLDSTGSVNQSIQSTKANMNFMATVNSCFKTEKELPEKSIAAPCCESQGSSDSGLTAADTSLDLHKTEYSGYQVVLSCDSTSAYSSYSSDGQDTACHLNSETNTSSFGECESIQYPHFPGSDAVKDNISQCQMPPFGRKRKRGKEEEIQVIEVNLADHLNNSTLELTKSLTMEQDMRSHSKKRNKDMPTSQQKRKHQITYLAHQAKERELELKNQWADNKFSKKQTQSKYGF